MCFRQKYCIHPCIYESLCFPELLPILGSINFFILANLISNKLYIIVLLYFFNYELSRAILVCLLSTEIPDPYLCLSLVCLFSFPTFRFICENSGVAIIPLSVRLQITSPATCWSFNFACFFFPPLTHKHLICIVFPNWQQHFEKSASFDLFMLKYELTQLNTILFQVWLLWSEKHKNLHALAYLK